MRRWAAVSMVLLAASFARGADAPVELGERFTGPYDVSFKPFAGGKPLPPEATGEIMRIGREDKKWLLTFLRQELNDDSPLKDSPRADGKMQAGYLSTAVNKLRANEPSTDVLRNEVIDLGDLRIGVLVATTHDHNLPVLLQEAMIEVTPKLYYTITMICPVEEKDPAQTPAAKEAGTVFKGILDSINRVDLSAMKQEQDDRLYRTRGLFATWNRSKIVKALQAERYLRFKRDGRDIGYGFVVEQLADALPKTGKPDPTVTDPAAAAGFRVGMSTHTLAEGGKVLDTESWQFVSFDRRHEVWSNVTLVTDPAGKTDKEKSNWFSEVGASDLQREREFKKNLTHDDFKEADEHKDDPNAQPYHEVERYKLLVRNEGRSAVAQPLERLLPPFYLPAGMGSILPRIVPRDNPTGYLFAVFNSESRQVMLKYVDVMPEQTVKIDGQEQRAVGVAERLGYAGSVTTHYFTPKGDYIGSVNNDTKVEIIPTDKATLQSLWKDIKLHEPAATK